MNENLAAASAMALSRLSDDEITTLNAGIMGFGRIQKGNIAFERALAEGLIRANGMPHDRASLEVALSLEISKRPTFTQEKP